MLRYELSPRSEVDVTGGQTAPNLATAILGFDDYPAESDFCNSPAFCSLLPSMSARKMSVISTSERRGESSHRKGL